VVVRVGREQHALRRQRPDHVRAGRHQAGQRELAAGVGGGLRQDAELQVGHERRQRLHQVEPHAIGRQRLDRDEAIGEAAVQQAVGGIGQYRAIAPGHVGRGERRAVGEAQAGAQRDVERDVVDPVDGLGQIEPRGQVLPVERHQAGGHQARQLELVVGAGVARIARLHRRVDQVDQRVVGGAPLLAPAAGERRGHERDRQRAAPRRGSRDPPSLRATVCPCRHRAPPL
jgi:hypothetical protein